MWKRRSNIYEGKREEKAAEAAEANYRETKRRSE